MRMANQFRGLESDELQFLDEVAQEEREKQRRVERQDAEELALFKYVISIIRWTVCANTQLRGFEWSAERDKINLPSSPHRQ